VLAKNGIKTRNISMSFQPFLSLDSGLLEQRARVAINAPDNISVSLDHGVLRLRGTAPHTWIVNARNAGEKLALAGIHRVAVDDLRDRELEQLRSEIEATKILFGSGLSEIAPRQTGVVEEAAAKLKEWVAGARAIGRTPRIEVVGHTDLTGSNVTNSDLSRQRAFRVAEMLRSEGVLPDWLASLGTGPRQGGQDKISAEPDALQRSVVFRLFLDPGPGR
jgi:OOP family OmpA-OmpF porin